jgi:hypothetical protein
VSINQLADILMERTAAFDHNFRWRKQCYMFHPMQAWKKNIIGIEWAFTRFKTG